ncbi:type II secretion system F family protein [Acetivibrio clariflavus]|uniref:Type II secretory pathway, component PulF n=1 Tax=Acetivibrio clariflavus (strain DSM 19732 / NBRC 101661 / EBR45) TaxID=720554 RepID=G8M0J8_ACECE|nr:type II secretion system F family protein [Acetivibrio clariflavus]AEV68043.1 type II secretory pathway, component PulF [Acetivibrio clariflavus DSM 19732]
MPVYSYKVKTETGKVYSGETKIDSVEELRRLLEEKGYTPIEIVEKNVFTDISTISLFKQRVKIKDLAIFCRQFAIILQAGVPIATCLDVLKQQSTNKTLKECLNDIYDDIQKGISLSNSMKKHENIFPELMICMVEAGEVSGQLDIVFERLARQYENQNAINSKIKSALTYPAIVGVIAVAVIVVLMLFVVPKFVEILEQFNTPLPIFTKILIAISDFFVDFWWALLGGVIALIVGIKLFSKSETGKMFIGNLAIKLPVIKGVTKNIITSRFARTLGTLMSSGVLLIQSMEVVQKILNNAVIMKKFDVVIDEIKKGKGLTQPLIGCKYFPPLLISMIRIGEESGSLDFTLEKASDFYDQEVETSIQQLMAFIEPLITIVLAVVVAFVVLSVLVPMLSIYQNAEF